MKLFILGLYIFNILTYSYVYCYPEQGKWDYVLAANESVVVTKSLYKGSKITVKILCEPKVESEELLLKVTWYLRKAACWNEFYETEEPMKYLPEQFFQALEKEGMSLANETSYYMTSSEIHTCDGKAYYLNFKSKTLLSQSDISAAEKQDEARALVREESDSSSQESDVDKDVAHALEKREDKLNAGKGDPKTVPAVTNMDVPGNEPLIIVADGIYQFVLGITTKTNANFSADVHIDMHSDYGYLSAADYPLLVFYSTMCVVYVVYGVGWLVVSFMRWRELLRVQYWIGAVILLGMLEKAVFTAEYESVNKRGESIPGLIVFAELVSCAKRTLSRMLVIIVSFGFGIVKPRLGIILHRVVGVGLLYFILASIEGCMRALRPKMPSDDYSKRLLFSNIPLALLESAICWWVFSALVSTTRTLRLRRNTIKLNLFRHFTNTLVFAVVTSVIFMLWSVKYKNYDACLSDWKQLWVNDAFWHVLFALILLVIMVLWRPTNNNQRFAFSPLLDEGSEGEEEEQEKLMANVSDTMKLRNSRASTSSSPRESRSVEDDLKWLEENIPSSIVDTGLPVMDSDEEILTTKFEISKMQ